jgi:murein L,D-transpeptidase YcbB/YkuD
MRAQLGEVLQERVVMRNRDLWLEVFVAAIALVLAVEAKAFGKDDGGFVTHDVREVIKKRLEGSGAAQKRICRGEQVCTFEKLRAFYERRLFAPVWSDDDGMLPYGEDLIRELEQAGDEGLRPEDYHIHVLQSLTSDLRAQQSGEEPPSVAKLADLDLLLTDAFLMYASHLVNGKVNPLNLKAGWYVAGRKADPTSLLESALQSNLIREMLKNLHPAYPGYRRLRQALAEYRKIAESGGWDLVPAGDKLRRGDSGERVAALKLRLIVSGDLERDGTGEIDVFDKTLEDAVKGFQARHGLAPDGVVGMSTVNALNVPASKRAAQIQWNMERWRWLPQTLGARYLSVNIANFNLEVREGERVVLSMRAIVGKPYQRTPVFSAKMTYLVLNPHWNVPAKIVRQEMLEEIRKSPGYLLKHNIRIFTNQDGKKREVDPKTIDWAGLSAGSVPFTFRQEAGPSNPLGRIKFMLPNEFEVYLHDTPHRQLFMRTARQFSHGCIRIEKPMPLAEYVLKGDPQWTPQSLTQALETEVDKPVRLPEPLDVHVLYWTSWVEEDGSVQFREDIYHRDGPLAKALEQRPPRP